MGQLFFCKNTPVQIIYELYNTQYSVLPFTEGYLYQIMLFLCGLNTANVVQIIMHPTPIFRANMIIHQQMHQTISTNTHLALSSLNQSNGLAMPTNLYCPLCLLQLAVVQNQNWHQQWNQTQNIFKKDVINPIISFQFPSYLDFLRAMFYSVNLEQV